MNHIVALALASLLTGCAGSTGTVGTTTAAYVPPSTTPYELSPRAEEGVKAGVARSLKDPTSPLYGDMRAAKAADGSIYVCGWVNAKNSYGGYVGNTPYIAGFIEHSNTAVLIGLGDRRYADQVITEQCQKHGAPLP